MEKKLELSDFGIKVRNQDSRFWVVRASGGEFIPNFVQGGVAAIGHLDNFINRPKSPKDISHSDLIKFLKNSKNLDTPNTEKVRIGNTKSQIENFVQEIKLGDTVVSVDSRTVAVGVATGEPFFNDDPIVVQHTYGPPTELKYVTRIPVAWEHQFKRRELPLVVRNTLQAHQTVFSLDRHWTYIYHLIYPIFADFDHIYYSNFIHQKKDVSANAMAKLMAFFSEIEPILFGNTSGQKKAFEEFDLNKLSALFEEQNSERYTSFKTEVFSEGPVWWKMPLQYIQDYRRVVILLLIVSAVFGGEMGPLKMPGIITPEMRETMLKFIFEKIDEHDIEKAKQDLMLDIPRKFSDPRINTAILSPKINT